MCSSRVFNSEFSDCLIDSCRSTNMFLFYTTWFKTKIRDTSFINSSISDSSFSMSNLFCVNFYQANLISTSFLSSKFNDVNLTEANTADCQFPKQQEAVVLRLDLWDRWSITIRANKTAIGCQERTNEFWLKAKPADVQNFDKDAARWWKENGAIVRQAIRLAQKRVKGLK